MLHFVPCARKRSFVALAVMASLAGLGMATAMRAAAQTAPPVRSAVVPPTAAAVPSVPAPETYMKVICGLRRDSVSAMLVVSV